MGVVGVVVVVAIVMVVIVVAPHASGTWHWLMSEQSPSAVAFSKPAQHAGVGQLPGPWWLGSSQTMKRHKTHFQPRHICQSHWPKCKDPWQEQGAPSVKL